MSSFLSFSDELEKIAEIVTPLKPHQQRIVSRIQQEDQPGLVVAHGLGSGKTLASIAAQDALGLPAEVVVPAALQENYAKEIKKHRKKGPKTQVKSLQNISRKGIAPAAPMLIVDEAHRLKDPATAAYQTIANNAAQKRLLLTATPFYNNPYDVVPLVNIAAGDSVLPRDKKEFESRYITEEEVDPGLAARVMGVEPGVKSTINRKNRESLKRILNKWVDYHPGSSEGFPSVTEETVRVPMTEEQLKYYDTVMNRAPSWLKWKIRSGMPPSKAEAKSLNKFLTGVRQVSNSTSPYITEGQAQEPKIDRAFQELQKALAQGDRAKAVVYSNFLGAGLKPYKERLEKAKIPYGEFTGELSKRDRDELIKKYNEDKIRALLLSSAGGEGLDLKGTRLIQMLEPHWNETKLDQAQGRGVRYMSHAHLPPEERNVRVQKFLSVRPEESGILAKIFKKKPAMSVDEYLTQMSQEKARLGQEFIDLLNREGAQNVQPTIIR